jgi:hypothetical protein
MKHGHTQALFIIHTRHSSIGENKKEMCCLRVLHDEIHQIYGKRCMGQQSCMNGRLSREKVLRPPSVIVRHAWQEFVKYGGIALNHPAKFVQAEIMQIVWSPPVPTTEMLNQKAAHVVWRLKS